MPPFDPLFRNPHVQTIAGHFWQRPESRQRYPVSTRLYRTQPDVQVLVASQRPEGPAVGEIVTVHGLEGSGEAGYIRSLAASALPRGFAVHAFHMRTCGGTERLCQTLYHAGLTSDLLAVLHEFQRDGRAPVFLAGFSLGGNVALKLAGELGARGPELIRGVCAASTPLDLDACATRLAHPSNLLYQRRFLGRMRARLCATGRYQERDFRGLRTIRQIDDHITAPSFGFGDADNYYRTQSCLGYLPEIRVPVLLVQSRDDTLVPFDIFGNAAVRSNPRIELRATGHGGHLGFLARRPHRFWLDETILEWAAGLTPARNRDR
jgi:predicted alpha/beta-fold hydrolase